MLITEEKLPIELNPVLPRVELIPILQAPAFKFPLSVT